MPAESSIRMTKYCEAILQILPALGHATNADLLKILQIRYPAVSATTVHRATARMAERGLIGLAPKNQHGDIRYDATTTAHDHFVCERCGMLRDADLKPDVTSIIEAAIDGCRISGRLTIHGVCKQCDRRSAA